MSEEREAGNNPNTFNRTLNVLGINNRSKISDGMVDANAVLYEIKSNDASGAHFLTCISENGFHK